MFLKVWNFAGSNPFVYSWVLEKGRNPWDVTVEISISCPHCFNDRLWCNDSKFCIFSPVFSHLKTTWQVLPSFGAPPPQTQSVPSHPQALLILTHLHWLQSDWPWNAAMPSLILLRAFYSIILLHKSSAWLRGRLHTWLVRGDLAKAHLLLPPPSGHHTLHFGPGGLAIWLFLDSELFLIS